MIVSAKELRLVIRSEYGYRKVLLFAGWAPALLFTGSLWAQQPADSPRVFEAPSKTEVGTRLFLEQIQPLFERNWLACHSTTSKQGELELSTRAGY